MTSIPQEFHFLLPQIRTLVIPAADKLPVAEFFLRQEKNMLKCSASREVPTYQLHPEFPRPLQAHCRAERGTGSCARKSHGDASSPVRKGDSSGSAIFAAGKSCVPYQAPLTDTNFQNKMGKMLWNVWPERSPLFFLSSHPLFSNFKTRFKPPTVLYACSHNYKANWKEHFCPTLIPNI